MDKKYEDTPLSYGISESGNNPFDFDRIFRMRPWVRDPKNFKDYLKSLIEHWVLLYEWNVPTSSMDISKKEKHSFFVAGQLFAAMALGQYVLGQNKHNAICQKLYYMGYVPGYYKKKAKESPWAKDEINKEYDDMILDSWNEQHITVRSVYLLFVMQMIQHDNSMEPFFNIVVKAHQNHKNSFYFKYMKSLWHIVQNSGYDMSYLYNTLNDMVRMCFNVKY